MHVSTFFQINHNNPKIDIFASIKDTAKIAKFKKLLTSNIISTDMVHHCLSLMFLIWSFVGYYST